MSLLLLYNHRFPTLALSQKGKHGASHRILALQWLS